MKMDDVPDLPFEKILSYLSLEDRIRSRGVSRKWCKTIDSFKTISLFYSSHPVGFIQEKRRLVSGAFVQNFISSSRFSSFFDTFGHSIFSNLKHLRLCRLNLDTENLPAFARTLQSFDQLEELGLFSLKAHPDLKINLELNLPMLNSIRLENLLANGKLTLNAPGLQTVRLSDSPLRVDLVHAESVERLIISSTHFIELKKLKNLKHLYSECYLEIDATFLASLKQLKEVHLSADINVAGLFEQKRRHARTDLKIYLQGLFLNGPEDPTIPGLRQFGQEYFGYLAENPSRLAGEVPFCWQLYYCVIEPVSRLEINLLHRFTSLRRINVNRPVQDIERFLGLLENCGNVVDLLFECAQPQDLFDRLPDHCALQVLITRECTVSEFGFLSRLENLIYLDIVSSIDGDLIRKVLEELQFLSLFIFTYNENWVSIKIGWQPKQFEVSVNEKEAKVSDPSAAIQFIVINI